MHLFPAFDPSDFGFGPVCNHCPISSRGYLQGVVPWSHYDYLRGEPKGRRAEAEEMDNATNGERTDSTWNFILPVIVTGFVASSPRLTLPYAMQTLFRSSSSPADGMPLHERSMPVLAAFPQRPYY
ncbi:hypothetical protein V8C44DRAFT_298641 [Trichoderma aethiopicum]